MDTTFLRRKSHFRSGCTNGATKPPLAPSTWMPTLKPCRKPVSSVHPPVGLPFAELPVQAFAYLDGVAVLTTWKVQGLLCSFNVSCQAGMQTMFLVSLSAPFASKERHRSDW